MSTALVLLAAAVVLAPWREPVVERLRELEPPGHRRGHSERRARDVLAHLGRSAWLLAPTRLRRDTAATGSLVRLLDLLEVSLVAGLPVHVALTAVADAVAPTDPGAAAPLRAVAARIRLGAPPAEAWCDVPDAQVLAPIAPVLTRVTDGGGSVRLALDHAAQRLRADADAAAAARAERAAVLVAGPLGLCFLPAFVCLGIVPVVIGLADGMLPAVLP